MNYVFFSCCWISEWRNK